MAEKRDINRWKKGEDHWNKWAQGRLKARQKLESQGKWEVDAIGGGANVETKRWTDSATVDFSRHIFNVEAHFDRFVFPHIAVFVAAEFKKSAGFDRATFSGNARFDTATFSGNAGFSWATFSAEALFDRATFSGETRFSGAAYSKNARFDECTFDGSAAFDHAKFNADASFNSAKSDGPFSLANATFERVPDFIQMSFRATARLDDLNVVQASPLKIVGDKGRAARYRALKKIAIEAHDHVREQQFFASEIKEQRGFGNDAPYYGAKFWFGLVYEILSNFGRSITLPIGWLIISSIGFAVRYGWDAPEGYAEGCKWAKNTYIAPEYYLSFLHSLPIVGFGRGEKRDEALDCLFGFGEKANISPGMDMLFIGQNIWSAILIFLCLLAVRNHFRIK